MKTDDYRKEQEKKAQDKIATYRPLIYDIETEQEEREIEIDGVKRNKIFHKPILIGFCYKSHSVEVGDDVESDRMQSEYVYNYYYGEDCVKDFIDMITKSEYTHIIGYNSGSFDYILLKYHKFKIY